MLLVDLSLGLAVVLAGIFAGLVTAMATVVQRMLDGLDGPRYAEVMHGIIRAGRRSRAVQVSLLGPIVMGGVAAAGLVLGAEVLAAGLVLAGVVVQLAGPLGLSRWVAEPLYDRILGWQTSAPPEDWVWARRRWHRINQGRAASAVLACALLLGGLVALR